MDRIDIINKLIEDALTHNPDEIMCFIAGKRKDNGKSYYTWGEYLESLKMQCGSVWDDFSKDSVVLIEQHPEIFKEFYE